MDDRFVGTNGDVPDPKKWSYTGSAEIQNNKLRLSANTSAGSSVISREHLTSDFEVIVDLNTVAMSAVDGSQFYIVLRSVADTTDFIQIRRIKGAASDDLGSLYWLDNVEQSGTVYTAWGSPTKWMIARQDGIFKTYYYRLFNPKH